MNVCVSEVKFGRSILFLLSSELNILSIFLSLSFLYVFCVQISMSVYLRVWQTEQTACERCRMSRAVNHELIFFSYLIHTHMSTGA